MSLTKETHKYMPSVVDVLFLYLMQVYDDLVHKF